MKCGLIPIRNVDHKKEGVERLEAWDVDVDMAKGGESQLNETEDKWRNRPTVNSGRKRNNSKPKCRDNDCATSWGESHSNNYDRGKNGGKDKLETENDIGMDDERGLQL